MYKCSYYEGAASVIAHGNDRDICICAQIHLRTHAYIIAYIIYITKTQQVLSFMEINACLYVYTHIYIYAHTCK